MSFWDWVPIYSFKCSLKSFQAFRVFGIFLVKVIILSGGILADNIGFGKVRHFLLL